MLTQIGKRTIMTAEPTLASFLKMGGLSALAQGAPGPAVIRRLMTSPKVASPEKSDVPSTENQAQLLTVSVESNKTSSEIIGGSTLLSKLFQPKEAPSARSNSSGEQQTDKQVKEPDGFVLVGEPYTKRPFKSRLPRLEKYTKEAALTRLENSPWQGKYSQVTIAKDGTCFYGEAVYSHFFERIYPLMVTTDGVCIVPQPGATTLILGSWNESVGNTSIGTIVNELRPKHTTYIRNISGEINPFCFSKTDEELNSATDEDRFDHIRRSIERNEPIYMISDYR